MQPIIEEPHAATFLEIVLPEQTNHYGRLYGANALQMMGKAAFVCATRHARCAVVMAKADSIEFARPILLGSIIDIRARIVFRGRSSMTVVVEIVPDGPSGRVAPAISGRFMMVAVDDAGSPIPIAHSDPNHAEEIRS
jgi:acyl-CoA hydrolase